MTTGKSQQRAQPRSIAIARAVIATFAILSLLSVLLPLGRASANSELQACCIGKAGHESGSCSTGLLASAKSQVSLPVAAPAKTKLFANVKGGAGAAGHCSSHASSSNDSDEPVNSPAIISEPASASSATSGKSVSLNIHAASSTCPNECGMCSVSYTRRPRPREQSTQSSAVKPPSTSLLGLIVSEHSAVRELKFKWSQSSPRAPPAFLV